MDPSASTAPHHGRYRFEGFALDVRARALLGADGTPVALTAKAFDVLAYLVAQRERFVGKDELLQAVWPGRVVEENNLVQAVSALRRALGTDASEHRYVVTVPGRGYRFIADVVEEAFDATVAAPRTPSTRTPVVVVALVLLVATGALLAWRLRPAPDAGNAPALAVLPFPSLSAGPRDQLLELGLADTLITRLSRSTALQVRPLAAVQRYAGARHDPLAAARALHVDYVVEGSSQRAGDAIRVNARLLSVADGRTLWADTVDAPLARAFTVQDRLASAIAAALSLRLAADDRHHSPCDGSDAAAYRAYLAGRYHIGRPDPVGLHQALAAFQQAIARDPSCARAWAGVSFAYRALVITGDRSPRDLFPLARAAAAQALAIDPDSAEALASKGYVQFWYDWDWPGAEASLQRAIALEPRLSDAHAAYAQLLVSQGRLDAGIAQAERARQLEPLSPMNNVLESGYLAAAGRPAEARAMLARALELQPGFWVALLYRGGMELDAGNLRAAIADLQHASAASHQASPAYATLAVAYARAGDTAAARQVLAALQARATHGYVPATRLAAVHEALGDHTQALALLEQAERERDLGLAFLGYERSWNGLRTQPRFRALARRIGIRAQSGSGRI
jgi:DNA-binding winged helix-turn-helix (wHTH) protein/TolB-like protein